MWFRIGNRNIGSFEEIRKVFNIVDRTDDRGNETYSIELNTLEDIMSLGAIAHTQLEFYSGVLINGDTITITQEGDMEWR